MIRRTRSLVFVIPFLLVSVTLGAKCKECMPRPLELQGYVFAEFMNKVYGGEQALESLTYEYKGSENENNYWFVYSDRVENPIYSTANGRKLPRQLDFMEKVYISEIMQGWVKIMSYEPVNGEMTYVPLGWIRPENLLLTTSALSNASSITKKGLVLINANDVQEVKAMTSVINSGGSLKKYMFYGNPERSVEFGEERQLEIRYILKELHGTKLLSLNDKLDGLSEVNRKNNVNGWMANVNVTPWDTRVCLETTYGKEYAGEYKGLKIPVFMKEGQLGAFTERGLDDPAEAIYRHEVTTFRKPNYVMRMPVLKNMEGSDIKVVATVGSVEGVSDSIEVNKAKLKELTEELKVKRNNINVLFVIDATSSMSDYYPAVNRGVEQIIKLNKEKYNKSMKFGVAVYRDYADGEQQFEVLPLTGDEQSVHDFLSNVVTRSIGKSRHESLYNGLIRGIKESQMESDQSNIVVLIGDAGNHREDEKGLNMNMVKKALSDYNTSLISFQVVFGGGAEFTDFNFDAQDMLVGIGQLSDRKGELQPILNVVADRQNAYELKFRDNISGNSRDYIEAGFGRFIHANDNEAMPLKELETNMLEALGNYLTALDVQINQYQSLSESETNRKNAEKVEDPFMEADLENFTKYLKEGGMSEEEIHLARQHFSQFSMRGYTQTKFYNKGLSCFNPVVFLSDQEVEQITSVFDRIDPNAPAAEAKKQIYDGLITQCKAALGETSDERVEKLTLSDIWNILLGVPFDEAGEYGNLKEIPLVDIPNSNHPMLPKFVLQFQQSVRGFTKNNLEEDRFRLNDQFYYWVPLEKIPGNG